MTMTLTSTASKCVDNKLNVSIGVLSHGTRGPLSVRQAASAHGSRGVLDGASAILDALAHAHAGLGLTDLARASGLAKTSARRVAEQFVVPGAVQRVALTATSVCLAPEPQLQAR